MWEYESREEISWIQYHIENGESGKIQDCSRNLIVFVGVMNVYNRLMKDLPKLQDAPFTDNGSIVEVFADLSIWMGIRKIIERINANAVAA